MLFIILKLKQLYFMKSNFFMLFCCIWLLSVGSSFGQAPIVNFNVQIWKNGTNLGIFAGSTDSDNEYTITANSLGTVCPGDELIIKNNIVRNGSAHDFTGTGAHRNATIGLSNSTGYNVPLSPFADVCTGICNPGDVEHFSSWNHGSTITVTVPASNYSNPYLVISTSIPGNRTYPVDCGPERWMHIPMNLAPTTSIADQNICPGDVINLPLDADFSYSNWLPFNPDGVSLSSTQTFTVDITHTATGCTQNEEFKINVSNPDVDPFATNESLCFADAGFNLTEDWFDNLFGANTMPLKILISGVLIADEENNIMNFPHVISSATYGTGTVTVQYTYYNFNTSLTCTKNYTITIHPEILTDIEDSYAVCDENFTSICALTGTIQIGVTYKWQKSGEFGVLATTPCFTPTEYGDYCLTLKDAFGCKLKKCFTVYDPGVGIQGLHDITYCSLTGRGPNKIGWYTDPFGGTPASFNWTYTDENGTSVSILNTAPYYNVPNLGDGTYTVVVSSGGCTETFTITVTDLLEIYNNHSNAAFSFNPLGGNMVACLPTIAMGSVTENWTVTDEFGNSIPTTTHGTGIRFNYFTGVQYTVQFERISYNRCQIFRNEFTWLDASNRNRRHNISDNLTEPTTSTEVQTFPNPTTGLVNIKLNNPSVEQTSIQVVNTLGAIVLEKEVKNSSTIELDLSNQTSGIYMIKVINGSNEFNEKVIKQ